MLCRHLRDSLSGSPHKLYLYIRLITKTAQRAHTLVYGWRMVLLLRMLRAQSRPNEGYRVASNRNHVRLSASSIQFSSKLALATSSRSSHSVWVSRIAAVNCLLSSRSSASMSLGVTYSTSLSRRRCKRLIWPIERNVVPPIFRTRSAIATGAGRAARGLFRFSILYLFLLFAVLLIERGLTAMPWRIAA
jgi:heme O synthase-like polyprenyltransferase